jgi:hypothetical protein
MTKTIPDTLVDRIDRKILHMRLIIGRYTKKNLFKEAVGASLESSRLPLQIVVKKRPARSKKSKKTPNNDALFNAGTQPTDILSYCARRNANIQHLA